MNRHYYTHGIISMKDIENDFFDKLKMLCNKHIEEHFIVDMCDIDDKLIEFSFASDFGFIGAVSDLINEYIGHIDCGQITNNLGGPNGLVKTDLPIYVFMEIYDGKLTEQSIKYQLPQDWFMINSRQFKDIPTLDVELIGKDFE